MDEEMIQRTEADAIVAVMERLYAPHTIDLERDGGVVFAPPGLVPHSMKRFRDELAVRPDRRTGTAKLTTLDSFCDHVNRFKNDDSAVFADEGTAGRPPRLVGVLNYHEGGPDGLPEFGDHRAVYEFPVSDAWQAWTGIRELSQADFAELLEDRLDDVADPGALPDRTKELVGALGLTLATPAELLKLSRGLALRVESKVRQAQNLSTGETELAYEETHRDEHGGKMRVPGGFALLVSVFQSGPLYPVLVRLRYRARGGSITWKPVLHRPEACFADAFGEACETAREKTALPLFFGTPE